MSCSALSVDRIAKASEVNKTSIYRRFPTRDALVVAAVSRVHDDLTAQIVDTGSLRGDLTALLRAVAAFLDGVIGRAVTRAVFAGPLAQDVGDVARARLAASAAASVEALVARARARGEWRDDVDVALLLAALVGALLHRALLEQSSLDDAFVEAVVDIVVVGAMPRSRQRRGSSVSMRRSPAPSPAPASPAGHGPTRARPRGSPRR